MIRINPLEATGAGIQLRLGAHQALTELQALLAGGPIQVCVAQKSASESVDTDSCNTNVNGNDSENEGTVSESDAKEEGRKKKTKVR